MNDDELMQGLDLDKVENEPDPGPPLEEWDLNVELLASVYDAINTLIGVTIQVNSDKRRPLPKPLPRPRTAIDRERDRRRAETTNEIIALFAPTAR